MTQSSSERSSHTQTTPTFIIWRPREVYDPLDSFSVALHDAMRNEVINRLYYTLWGASCELTRQTNISHWSRHSPVSQWSTCDCPSSLDLAPHGHSSPPTHFLCAIYLHPSPLPASLHTHVSLSQCCWASICLQVDWTQGWIYSKETVPYSSCKRTMTVIIGKAILLLHETSYIVGCGLGSGHETLKPLNLQLSC